MMERTWPRIEKGGSPYRKSWKTPRRRKTASTTREGWKVCVCTACVLEQGQGGNDDDDRIYILEQSSRDRRHLHLNKSIIKPFLIILQFADIIISAMRYDLATAKDSDLRLSVSRTLHNQ